MGRAELELARSTHRRRGPVELAELELAEPGPAELGLAELELAELELAELEDSLAAAPG